MDLVLLPLFLFPSLQFPSLNSTSTNSLKRWAMWLLLMRPFSLRWLRNTHCLLVYWWLLPLFVENVLTEEDIAHCLFLFTQAIPHFDASLSLQMYSPFSFLSILLVWKTIFKCLLWNFPIWIRLSPGMIPSSSPTLSNHFLHWIGTKSTPALIFLLSFFPLWNLLIILWMFISNKQEPLHSLTISFLILGPIQVSLSSLSALFLEGQTTFLYYSLLSKNPAFTYTTTEHQLVYRMTSTSCLETL